MNIKILRRIVQASGMLFIIAVPFLNKKGHTAVAGTLYSFAVGPVWITDPVIGVQAMLTTLSVDLKLLVSLTIPLLTALAFGRVFCGWLCPQNAVSELADFVSEKMKIRRVFRPFQSPVPRLAFLGALLIITMVAGFPLISLFSAPGILSVQTAKFLYEGTAGAELSLIGIIIFAEMFLMRRAWCNGFCPVGGFLGLFRVRRTMKVVYREDRGHVCGRCYVCVAACRLGLDPVKGDIYPQCHNCGDCIRACASLDDGKRPLLFEF